MQCRQSVNVYKIMMVSFKPDLDYKIESDACLGDYMYVPTLILICKTA